MVDETAKIVAVAGAKGGAGATTFAQVLAFVLSECGDVLMIDADPHCNGDVAASVGLVGGARDVADILENLKKTPELIRGYVDMGYKNLGLASFAAFDHDRNATNSQLLADFVRMVSKYYSYVLIDFGFAEISLLRPVFQFVHKLSLVLWADLSSIGSAVKRIKEMKECGADIKKIDVIVNGWRDDLGLTEDYVAENLGIAQFTPFTNRAIAESFVRKVPIIYSSYAEKFKEAVSRYSDAWSFDQLSGSMIEPDDGLPLYEEESDQCLRNKCAIKERILKKLTSENEIKKIVEANGTTAINRSEIRKRVMKAVNNILDKETEVFDREALAKEIIDDAIGFGPLEDLMADRSITEIMVNAKDEVYVEKSGRLEAVDAVFLDDKNIFSIIEKIVAPIGRRVDESSPIVDARLPDGSRAHIVIPPLALKGPTITIRKFREEVYSKDDLVALGSISGAMAEFLEMCVLKRLNVMVSGGTGSGKTTMLNIMSSFIPPDERIVTIEDSAELKLNQPHVVRLESRPPNIEGKGEVTIRDLVKASLRMRPNRIIIGEVRGAEALDMLQAMNTGHDGSITTIHANSGRDSIARLETLVLFSGFEFPVKAIREQIASAIDIIIQMKRLKNGERKVVSINEITGIESQTLTMQELFVFDNREFISTGFRPRFLDR